MVRQAHHLVSFDETLRTVREVYTDERSKEVSPGRRAFEVSSRWDDSRTH